MTIWKELLFLGGDLGVAQVKAFAAEELALEAAIMELTLWAEQLGATEVSENVRGSLSAIDKNEEFIKMTLAVMMTPE